MISNAKSLVRQSLYALRFYTLFHRIRNRNTLTVFMFHRVLPSGSTSFERAEREFTMSVDGFDKCMDFVKKHYNVVSHAAVNAHFFNATPLPTCAALITFDDGWRDTLVHALPVLKSRNLPAVLFLPSEVLELTQDRWWQDMLVEALLNSENLSRLEAEINIIPNLSLTRSTRLRHLTSALAETDVTRRYALLSNLVTDEVDTRQMLTESDLSKLAPNVSIAGHGHTHGPLPQLTNIQADLDACAAKLRQLNADSWAISYPHGAQDTDTLEAAKNAGFKVCYSSEPSLVDTSIKRVTNQALGRIHIPENEWTCDGSSISNSKLATFIFFRKIK